MMKRCKRIPLMRALFLIATVVMFIPSVAMAGVMYDLKVSNATYFNGNQSLKSLDTTFKWSGAQATSRLVLMTEKLQSSRPGYSSYGDLTDLGYYGRMFSSFDKAKAHDDTHHVFGIINYSDEHILNYGSSNKISFSFKQTDIPLDKDKDYYVYLWSYYRGHYYPDYLFTVIRVKDGKVSYTTPNGRNDFDDKNFAAVETQKPTVAPTIAPTVVPADQIKDLPKTGDASQFGLWMALLVSSFSVACIVLRRNKTSRN